jgi:hypothetical protein
LLLHNRKRIPIDAWVDESGIVASCDETVVWNDDGSLLVGAEFDTVNQKHLLQVPLKHTERQKVICCPSVFIETVSVEGVEFSDK